MTTAAAPLEYANPPAFPPHGGARICPLCAKRPATPKTLYGHPVCKKCLYGFTNRRQLAYLVDSLIFTLPAIPLYLLLERSAELPEVAAFLISTAFGLVVNLVFVLRDGFDGRSPGKRLAGVQVVDVDSGAPISFGQSFKRNWWFLLGAIPGIGGLISLALVITVIVQMNKGPRLGDRAARTRVIWRRHADSPVFGGADVRCRSCGYDLTGNQSGRCPECGSPTIAPPVAIAANVI